MVRKGHKDKVKKSVYSDHKALSLQEEDKLLHLQMMFMCPVSTIRYNVSHTVKRDMLSVDIFSYFLNRLWTFCLHCMLKLALCHVIHDNTCINVYVIKCRIMIFPSFLRCVSRVHRLNNVER